MWLLIIFCYLITLQFGSGHAPSKNMDYISEGNLSAMDFDTLSIPIPVPTRLPSKTPTKFPRRYPTRKPSQRLSTYAPSSNPSLVPSVHPSAFPLVTIRPSSPPTTRRRPSLLPSRNIPTTAPSFKTTSAPSIVPTVTSTWPPSRITFPTTVPSSKASKVPSSRKPSKTPTARPSKVPTATISWPPSLAPTAAVISYHGGPVTVTPLRLYNIYFGKFDIPTMNTVDYFSANIGNSPYLSTVSKNYYQIDAKTQARRHANKSVEFVKRVTYKPGGTKLKVSEVNFTAAMDSMINSYRLPIDPNGLYTIMFRGDFTYPGWNTKSGGFCGYHTLFRIFDVDAAKYVYLKMSIIGNPWSASPPFYSCMSPYSPNNLPGADSIVTIYAHELTETMTDFEQNAWYSSNNYCEIADFCSWMYGPTYAPNTSKKPVSTIVKPVIIPVLTSYCSDFISTLTDVNAVAYGRVDRGFPTSTTTKRALSDSSNTSASTSKVTTAYIFSPNWTLALANATTIKYFAIQLQYQLNVGCVNQHIPSRRD